VRSDSTSTRLPHALAIAAAAASSAALALHAAGTAGCGSSPADEVARLQGIPAAPVRTHLARRRKEVLDLAAKRSSKGDW